MIEFLTKILSLVMIADINFSIGEIISNGERLAGANKLVTIGNEAELVSSGVQSLTVSLSLILATTISFLIICYGFVNSINKLYYRINFNITKYFLFFILYLFAITLLNNQNYTDNQLLVVIIKSFRYSVLLLVFPLYYYSIYLFKNETVHIKFLIHGYVISLIFSIIHLYIYPIPIIVTDRLSFFGPYVIIINLFVVLIFSKSSLQLGIYKKPVIIFLILLGIFFLTITEKRVILLGIIVSVSYIFLYYRLINSKSIFAIFIIFLSVIFIYKSSTPEVVGEYTTDALSQKYSNVLERYELDKIQNIDRSSAERIAKIIFSYELFLESPLYGSGYLSTLYKEDYLPDSGMQILIEFGVIGTFIMQLPFLIIWIKSSKILRRKKNEVFIVTWRATYLSLIFMSSAANIFFNPSLLILFMALTAITVYRINFNKL